MKKTLKKSGTKNKSGDKIKKRKEYYGNKFFNPRKDNGWYGTFNSGYDKSRNI
jgi:hypothetical protein